MLPLRRFARLASLIAPLLLFVLPGVAAEDGPPGPHRPPSFFAHPGTADGVNAVVALPDGQLLLVGQNPFTLRRVGPTGLLAASATPLLDPPPMVVPGGAALLQDGRLVLTDPFRSRLLVAPADAIGPIETKALTWNGKPLPLFALAVAPSGDLVGSSYAPPPAKGGIFRVDAKTFAVSGPLVETGSGGLTTANGLAFGHDGQLYAADYASGSILRFDSTGRFTGVFASIGRADGTGLGAPAFGPDGSLYAIERQTASVLRFDGRSGAFIAQIVPAGAVQRPVQLAFTPDGDLLVFDFDAKDVLRVRSPASPPAPAPVAATPAPASVVTPTCLALERAAPAAPAMNEISGLLARELLRQTVLLAARDAGAITRDAVLREPLDRPDCLHLLVQTSITATSARLTLLRPGQPFPSLLGAWDTPLPGSSPFDYVALATGAERLAPALARALQTAGLRPASVPAAPAGGAPATGAPTAHTSLVQRFAAARRAHAGLRRAPQDPTALAELGRAYADLAWLTQTPTYGAAYKVFGARSLLYAARLARTSPGPAAAAARAYGLALLGLHAAAVRDLDAARGAPGEADRIAVLRAYCSYDVAGLMRLAKPPLAELASTLAFAAAIADQSQPLLERTGVAALAANPDDLTAYRGLRDGGSLGVQGMAVGAVGPRFEQSLFADLANLPDLPAPVGQTLGLAPGLGAGLNQVLQSIDRRLAGGKGAAAPAPENLPLRARVAERLVEAGTGDSGEPSFAALGRAVQEEDFLEALHLVMYRRDKLAVPVSETLRELEPLLAGHPARGIADGYGLEFAREPERYRKLLDDVAPAEPVPVVLYFANYLQSVGTPAEKERAAGLQRAVMAALDETAPDLPWRGANADTAQRLQSVSPSSPVAAAWRIDTDWPSVAAQAQTLEATFDSHPNVLRSLAAAYGRLGRFDDQERLLRRVVRAVPDRASYAALAQSFLSRGREADWQATLDEFIARHPPGLDEPRAQVDIAEHFNRAGDYAKAKPYAEAAAESYAEWALHAAAESCEGTGDFAAAERFQRAASERYEDAAVDWYLWCMRTGHGDPSAALAHANRHIASVGGNASRDDLESFAVVALLAGDTTAARQRFAAAFAQQANPYDGLFVAILATEQRDPAAAAAAFERIAAVSPSFLLGGAPRFQIIQLADLGRAFLAGSSRPAELAQAAELLWSTDERGERTNLEYFLARLLELKGEHDLARRHLLAVASSSRQDKWTAILARAALRAAHVEPPPAKPPHSGT